MKFTIKRISNQLPMRIYVKTGKDVTEKYRRKEYKNGNNKNKNRRKNNG